MCNLNSRPCPLPWLLAGWLLGLLAVWHVGVGGCSGAAEQHIIKLFALINITLRPLVVVVVVVFQPYDSRTPLDPHCRAPSVNIRTRRHGPLVCLSQRRRGDRRRSTARPVHTRNALSDTWNRSNDDSVHHKHSNLHDRSTLRNGTLSHKRPIHMASIGECNRSSGPPPSSTTTTTTTTSPSYKKLSKEV